MPRPRNPTFALRADLTGVRALPLLQQRRRFRQARRQDAGEDQRALHRHQPARDHVEHGGHGVRRCSRTARSRGLNVAQMIRSLTSGTLSGWQESEETGDRSVAAFGVVQDRQGPGADHRSQSGRPAGQDDRRRHHRSRHQADRVPRRAEARDDHRRPGPRHRSGRARHSRDDRGPVGRSRASIRRCRASSTIPTPPMPSCKEMGKGLFGAQRRRPWCGDRQPARRRTARRGRRTGCGRRTGRTANPLGGQLGETIGNLLQQGLSGLGQSSGQGGSPPAAPRPGGQRSIPCRGIAGPGTGGPAQIAPAEPAAPAPPSEATAQQDSQPMNEVLRQLFNR